jgi:hypothetical protein
MHKELENKQSIRKFKYILIENISYFDGERAIAHHSFEF